MKKADKVAEVDMPLKVYAEAIAKISGAAKCRKPEAPARQVVSGRMRVPLFWVALRVARPQPAELPLHTTLDDVASVTAPLRGTCPGAALFTYPENDFVPARFGNRAASSTTRARPVAASRCRVWVPGSTTCRACGIPSRSISRCSAFSSPLASA